MLMYLGIFLGVAAIVSTQGQSNDKKNFEAASYAFSVFDEDNSRISRNLINVLAKNNDKTEIEDGEESIQDALYSRWVNCVIRIPKGFGKSVENGGEVEKIELFTIPGTIYSETFQSLTNQYIMLIQGYLAGGFSTEEAVMKAELANQVEAEVTMTEGSGGAVHSILYYWFAYIPYIFVCICVVGIGPILIVFHRKEIKERNTCSSYSLMRMNLELLAGTVTAGLGLCVLFFLMVFAVMGVEVLSLKGLLFICNMLCFLVVALGLAFFVGQVVKKTATLSMISNVVGLGISFLGGVFVPLEYLGDGIIKAAHLLPSYWYIIAVRTIDTYTPGGNLSSLWMSMGIEVLFGTALIAAGLAFSKVKMHQVVA